VIRNLRNQFHNFGFLLVSAYRVRISYPLQWGAPTFDAGDVFGVMTAALVALVEVIILMIWVASLFFHSPLILYCYSKVCFHSVVGNYPCIDLNSFA
jgi:hypothetical protein